MKASASPTGIAVSVSDVPSAAQQRAGSQDIRTLFSIILLLAIAGASALAQSVANYAPSISTGATFTSITGSGTSFPGWRNATSTEDNRSLATNIGFTFYFMGQAYTQFSVSTNGFLDFSTSTAIGSGTGAYGYANTQFSALSTPTIRAIAPLYDDLRTAGNPGTQAALDASMKYQMSGSAPNRVLTVEWNNFDISGSTGMSISFQVKLYETSGAIEIIYGTMTRGTGGTLSYTVGINGLTMSATPTSAELLTRQWADNSSQFGNLPKNTLDTIPATNDKITFTPVQNVSPASPTSLTFTNVGASIQVGWTDNSTTETYFTVFRSTDNVNFTQAGTVASTTSAGTSSTYSLLVTGLSPSTPYYFRVTANNEASAPSSNLAGSNTSGACAKTGTFTVGPSGTYSTLTAAIADVTASGLSGTVILELQAAYTSTGETFPITIGSIPCASATNTLTIRPETGATGLIIKDSSSLAQITFDLNGAKYVTIDGRPGGSGTAKHLTIVQTALSATANALRFINDASYNTVQYCVLRGANTSSTGGVVLFGGTTGTTGNDNNTIDNCDLRESWTGFPLNLLYASGTITTLTHNNSNNTISNNQASTGSTRPPAPRAC
ncbi:MAG: fibronectin type III domain-containing protein [Ignavibacteria bacterium]|nr:fibronectin type III domain-containing protein [Ignavibacteria bacterium]